MLIRYKTARRIAGGALVVVGGVLMWLAPEHVLVGGILLAAGILLELLGITLERQADGPETRQDG